MKYLLDTHTLIWARLDPQRLSRSQLNILSSSDKQKYISTISIWEISLKFSLQKLSLGGHTPEQFLETALTLGFKIINPSSVQYASFYNLPKSIKHKDPFDRMLIWQAIQSQSILLSSDKKMADYKINGLLLG